MSSEITSIASDKEGPVLAKTHSLHLLPAEYGFPSAVGLQNVTCAKIISQDLLLQKYQ